ncbi:P-type conjugative transfer protein TrbL [Rubrivirga sp. S365]|uniref:P-type conjugative transfer protein TrbL n=1 Tax=Rubrivirga sp. S365 TaxID=3076080 RepID=UPI0028C5C0FB|nr:P-type conjugative transfer protein TrbL [Rubrivirga sp. S365]MDT7858414.1 P-type conjugative transfer protein TrbL [Rubrivirga sp. S365]
MTSPPLRPLHADRQRPLARRVLGGAGLAALTLALAPEAAAQLPPPEVLDTIVEDFRTAADSARPALLAIARGTFGVLAIIEIALSGLFWTLRAEGPYKVLTGLVVKLGWLAFAFGLIATFDRWFPPIINGFLAAGQSASPGTFSPGEVLGLGVQISTSMVGAMFEELSLLDIDGPTLTNIVLVAIAALVMEILFAVIAGMVVLVLVESFLVLACGSLVLGFAAFRGTASLADRFVAYVFAVGIKLFLLFLLVSVGMDIAEAWLPIIESNPGDVAPMLAVLGGAITFALLVIVLPSKASSFLTRDFQPGFVKALASV